ncbi:hypothetical protein HanRHA438_Chr15g0724521 [Helianthus annuus]|uniref:Uncharacterized protein n=1 Tax=Helianthus annuus TaxID=4232 RepID=A0A251SAY0_HELAN|nr:hypothetical protein HanXRQr2_Chr15g0712241 [Helianthus annuus]KAJ0832869.1 hypothetical protein HanPSC8_Chr15g0683651 [Helianthus annuus]KAJ0846411.1 hypothetical protein HanRHA438_Chr15g0724521 [Helianthus annuus]
MKTALLSIQALLPAPKRCGCGTTGIILDDHLFFLIESLYILYGESEYGAVKRITLCVKPIKTT